MIPPVYESVRTLEASKRPATDARYEWTPGVEGVRGTAGRREDFKEKNIREREEGGGATPVGRQRGERGEADRNAVTSRQ